MYSGHVVQDLNEMNGCQAKEVNFILKERTTVICSPNFNTQEEAASV